jgi:type I restriction enzyme, S subunit
MNDALFLIKTIADLTSKVGSGTTPKGGSNIYTRNGPKLIRSQNIHPGRLNLTDTVCIPEEIHQSMNATRVEGGDVLLNITGASIGRCAIAPFDIGEANVNQHVCIIRLEPGEIDSSFLMHYLNSYGGQVQINRFQAGGNREGLNFAQIRSMEIPCPPLPEQKKIAEILSGIDRAIESQCVEIDKVSTMHRIACQQKISDLSHNSEIATIGSISNKIMDYRGKSPPKHETGVPLITAKNIRKGFIDMNPAEFIQEDRYEEWMAKGIPSSGDILVTTEAPLGNVAIAPSNKFAIGQRVICISPNRRRITPEYLLACMKTDYFQGQLTASSTGSTVSGVRQGVLLDCNIPLPEIEWQRRIGSFDLNANKLITALNTKKAKLETLKQSLTSDLLSGRQRVSI